MTWQDLVFTTGSAFFTISLLPTLLSPSSRVPITTSLPTAVCLVVFSAAYLTLGLYLSALSAAVLASVWGLVARYRSER